MTGGRYGLAPPWDADQAALNAAEILHHVKGRTGRYTELRELALTCKHGNRVSQLVRYFTGPDNNGEPRTWLLVAALKLKGRHVPALCTPLPRIGERAPTLAARCARCRGGWVMFPGGLPDAVAGMRANAEVVRLVLRAGPPAAHEWAEGDETEYVEGREWRDGPGPVVRLRVDPPTLGTVPQK